MVTYADSWLGEFGFRWRDFTGLWCGRLLYRLRDGRAGTSAGSRACSGKVQGRFREGRAPLGRYFCGLKGMMPGITEMLEGVCKEKGISWEEKLKEWKGKGQWHVEVY